MCVTLCLSLFCNHLDGENRAGCFAFCCLPGCLVIVVVLFLEMPKDFLQFVIVFFPDHTHLLFLNAFYWYQIFILHSAVVNTPKRDSLALRLTINNCNVSSKRNNLIKLTHIGEAKIKTHDSQNSQSLRIPNVEP